VLGRRGLCLLAVLAVTALFALQLPQLRVDPSLEKTFPRLDPRLADYERLQADYAADEDTALCVVEFPESVLAPATLARIHALTEALERQPWVDPERVVSLTRATFVRAGEDGDLDIGPLFTPEREAGWDAVAMQEALAANPAFDQRLLSRDQRLAGFWVPMALGTEGEAERQAFVRELRAFFSPEGALLSGEVAHLDGAAVARDTLQAMILEDTWALCPLAFAVLLVVLAVLFRRLVAPALALGVVGGSIVWTLGAMAWADVPFNTLSACIPVMVLVASVGDVVHLLTRYRAGLAQGADREVALRSAVHHVAGPCLLTSLTTAAGFASLGLSQVEVLQEFGVPVAGGVLAAYFVTLGALPTLLTWLPAPRQARVQRSRARGEALLEGLVRVVSQRPGRVLVAGAALLSLSLVALPQLSRDARLMDDLDGGSSLVQTRELLEQRFGGAAFLEVVLDSGEAGGVLTPEVQAGTLALTRTLRGPEFRERGVLSALSLPDFLRDAYWTWNERDPAFDRLPESAEALAQLHLLYAFGDHDPTAELVDDPSDPSQQRIRVRLDNLRTSEFFALTSAIEAEAARVLPADVEVTLTGSTYMARLVTESLVGEMLHSAGMAILLVGARAWRCWGSCAAPSPWCWCSASWRPRGRPSPSARASSSPSPSGSASTTPSTCSRATDSAAPPATRGRWPTPCARRLGPCS
jgi:predicted RND superfamily exporter protein